MIIRAVSNLLLNLRFLDYFLSLFLTNPSLLSVSDRIAKESYVRLQEDYYKSLKKGEELSEKCENSEALIQQLKDQIAALTTESSTLKQVCQEVHAQWASPMATIIL